MGETYRDLSGCTNQMLLLSAAHHELSRLGIQVGALSTEEPARHAHLDASLAFPQVGDDDAAALPHVDRDGRRYLTRWTLVLGGPRHGLLVDQIDDSVGHTRAVVDLLVADRLRS